MSHLTTLTSVARSSSHFVEGKFPDSFFQYDQSSSLSLSSRDNDDDEEPSEASISCISGFSGSDKYGFFAISISDAKEARFFSEIKQRDVSIQVLLETAVPFSCPSSSEIAQDAEKVSNLEVILEVSAASIFLLITLGFHFTFLSLLNSFCSSALS